MSINQYHHILSEEDIHYLLQTNEVIHAKRNIDSKNDGVIYFNIPLDDSNHMLSIKNKLSEHFGLHVENIKYLPMRWIKGDTKPHMDRDLTGSAFTRTHLVYLTSSSGSLVINNESYPITQGSGYAFDEGLHHETVNTGVTPRLLLGPMNEFCTAVGGPTTIYIQQNGSNQEYSYDQSSWNPITWPFTIGNGYSVEFVSDITLTSNNQYFICGGNNLIGKYSLNSDGSRPTITIDNVTNYPGLFQNGTEFTDGNSVGIYNLKVNAINGSSLVIGGGWIGQSYYGKNAQFSFIINCDVGNSPIGEKCGGIVGSYAASGSTPTDSSFPGLGLALCSSSGNIDNDAGGIIGWRAGYGTNNINYVTLFGCWSTGSITGMNSGGIVGSEAAGENGRVEIAKCYSTGTISGAYSGGIVGANAGQSSSGTGQVNIQASYSNGSISGSDAGGILGGIWNGSINVQNCYSNGNVTNSAGGICGYSESSNEISIMNCYTSGSTDTANGYIIAGFNDVNTSPISYWTLSNNYSEAANSTFGWSSVNAKATLFDTPINTNVVSDTWVETITNQPFEVNIGYTPYTINIFGFLNIVNYYEQTVTAGNSSIAAIVSGKSYSILQKSGGTSSSYNTITIDSNTGVISTTSATAPGTYTLYIRNSGSYYISSFSLTVNSNNKTVISTRVMHDNSNYTDYRITYYSDNSAFVQVYQKNMRTNCYQLVRSVNIPYCVPT